MQTRRLGAVWWSWLLPAALAALGGGWAYLFPPAAESPGPPVRYREFKHTDVPFHSETVINGRTVSCADGEAYNHTYPGPMYTCRNISVDGTRIAYAVMVRGDEKHVCGEEKGGNSIYWLCSALLNASSSAQSKVWAAYASEAVCDGHEGNRVRFVHSAGATYWEDSVGSDGIVLTLQCLVELEPQQDSFYDYA